MPRVFPPFPERPEFDVYAVLEPAREVGGDLYGVSAAGPARLVIWLTGLSGNKEKMQPYLQDLAREGFVALSFDPWQHGERGMETSAQMLERVFGAFRKRMWPIPGQTTLDTLRVIE